MLVHIQRYLTVELLYVCIILNVEKLYIEMADLVKNSLCFVSDLLQNHGQIHFNAAATGNCKQKCQNSNKCILGFFVYRCHHLRNSLNLQCFIFFGYNKLNAAAKERGPKFCSHDRS